MRWTDLATWRGPSPNITKGGMREWRGFVVHIAEGYYEGTISWQLNPDAETSSHFVIDRDGVAAQVVDTADAAWTQRDGNGHWLSVECAGFTLGHKLHQPGWEKLTDAMVDTIARLLLRAHQQYGVPLQLAGSPEGRGLGYHSMGGTGCTRWNWGHCDCPGEPIEAQLPAIVERAKQLAAGGGGDEDDVGASTDPIDIRTEGFTSLSIPPVGQGDADPRPAWFNVGNDTGGERYALRLMGLKPGGWYPLAGAGHEDVVIAADSRASYQLETGTYAVSIVRRGIDAAGKPVPASAEHPAYAGHLSCCFERGPVVK